MHYSYSYAFVYCFLLNSMVLLSYMLQNHDSQKIESFSFCPSKYFRGFKTTEAVCLKWQFDKKKKKRHLIKKRVQRIIIFRVKCEVCSTKSTLGQLYCKQQEFRKSLWQIHACISSADIDIPMSFFQKERKVGSSALTIIT